jgi:hypothetical protein
MHCFSAAMTNCQPQKNPSLHDPRERGDLSKKRPDRLAELREQWEDWDREMLPLPTDAAVPMSNLSAMLW